MKLISGLMGLSLTFSMSAFAGQISNTSESVSSVMMGAGGLYVYVKQNSEKAYVIDRTVVGSTGLSIKELADVILSSKSSFELIFDESQKDEHRIIVKAVESIVVVAPN